MAHDHHDHAEHAGHGAGHATGHDAHGHGAAPPEPPPPHVFTIARGAYWTGLGLWAVGLVAAIVLGVMASCPGFWTAAFASLYGLCIWLAARSTLQSAPA